MSVKSWLAGVAAVGSVAAGAAIAGAPAALANGHLPHQAVVKKATSQVWAGYAALADRRRTFRYVAADFTVPAANACGDLGDGSGGVTTTQWVGLGGYSHSTAERIGVGEACDFNAEDGINYWGFYSGKFGSGTFLACLDKGSSCPIDAGDRVELSAYYNGKTYRLILRDVTHKVFKRVYLRCPKCRSTSAEVINRVDSGDRNGPLTELFYVNFFGVRVTSVGGTHGTVAPQPRYWTSVTITQLDFAGDIVGAPSALRRNGRAFDVLASVLSFM